MKTIRFLAAARRELLAEVLHYNEMEAVYYLDECRELIVIAVAHHTRRPGYWVGRLK
jgi:hypothetical protein